MQSPPKPAPPECPRGPGSWLRRGLVRLRTRTSRERPGRLDLASLADSLAAYESLSGQLQGRFSEVGDGLLRLSEQANRLVRDSEALLVSASGAGEDGEVLRNTVDALNGPLGFLDQCQQRFIRMIERLELCDRQIRDILRLQGEWTMVIAPLKHIRTLCKIESASLAEEYQTLFLAVTANIEDLEGRVCTMFEEKFVLLGSIHGTMIDLVQHLRTVLPEQQQRTRQKREEISRSLHEVQSEIQANSRRDLQLTRATRALADTVSQLVVALQSDDIVAQKSAHVLEACRQLLADLEAAPPGPEQATVARVQSAQLAAIQQDLGEAESSLRQGLASILHQLRHLDSDCLSLQDLGKVTVSTDGMVQVLLDALSETEALVPLTLNEASRGYDRLQPLGEATSTLTETMIEVSVSMHLIAINAQIQAIQHGHGTGLEVLSARMADISATVTSISSRALVALNQLADELHQTVSDFDGLRTEGATFQDQMTALRRDQEGSLHALRDRSLGAMQEIGRLVAEIEGESRRLDASATVGSQLDTVIRSLCGGLDAVAAAAPRGAPGGNMLSRETAEPTRYTMDAERRVHVAAVHAAVPPTNTQATTAKVSGQQGGAIELF